MLNLAERVSKRARIGSGTFGLDDPEGILDQEPLPGGLCHSESRTQPSLQINLDPAGCLAYTQTRVSRPPEPVRLAIDEQGAAPGVGPICTAAPRLDLAAASVGRDSSLEFVFGSAAGGTSCGSARDDSYGDGTHIVATATQPANFTWDDFDTACGIVEPSISSCTFSQHAPVCQVDFSPPAKAQVVMAAANAAMGLESNLVEWDEQKMQLRVLDAVMETPFGNYLIIFTRCGSYIRRLRAAATSLRRLVQGRNDSRTALALAASIESEVNDFVLLPEFHPTNGLVKLYAHCFKVDSLAANLAELVGCADMNAGGRLLRVPPAVTILERAYTRAALQQSQRWHGAMLWKLLWATTTPWIDQLSFAVGLTEQLVVREASLSMKDAYFPELFLDPSEESGTVIVNTASVPSFVPFDTAQAAGQCYNMLILLGLKGYHAVHAAKTDTLPLSSNVRIMHNDHNGEAQPRYLSLTSQQPNNVHAGVHALFNSLHPSSPKHEATEPDADPGTMSVESQFWRVLAPVLVRQTFLNGIAKKVLQDELSQLRDLVVGVYLLGNGQFWSVFQDLAAAAYNDWNRAASYLPAMNALVQAIEPSMFFSLGTEWRGDLRLACSYPTTITTAFGHSCMRKWHITFSTLLQLHYSGQYLAFALLAADITVAVRRIDQTLNDALGGIQEVVEAFDQIPTGQLAE